MEPYNYWNPPPVKPRRGCCIPLSAGVLVLGVVGVALGLAALTAYAVLQAPTLRSSFGDYFSDTSADDIDSVHQIQYTSEIIVVVVTGLLGILSNCLLIYGVVSSRRWFLVHWLVYHVVIVAGALVAAILILLLQTGFNKLYSLIPIFLIVTLVLSWVKVYQLFCEIELQLPPAAASPARPPCHLHSNPHLNLPPPDFGWGAAGGSGPKDWFVNKDDMFEFYPADKLSWMNSHERSRFGGSLRDPWSQDRHMENTLYCDSESTVSSIVPHKNTDYDYTTLPVGGKGKVATNSTQDQRRSSEGTTGTTDTQESKSSSNNIQPTSAGIPGAKLNGVRGSFKAQDEDHQRAGQSEPPHPPPPPPPLAYLNHHHHHPPPHLHKQDLRHFNPPPGRHFMDMGQYIEQQRGPRVDQLPRIASSASYPRVGRPGHYENRDMTSSTQQRRQDRQASQHQQPLTPGFMGLRQERGIENQAFSGDLNGNRNSQESRTDSNLTNAEI